MSAKMFSWFIGWGVAMAAVILMAPIEELALMATGAVGAFLVSTYLMAMGGAFRD